jgi:hypothetical protein
MPDFMKDWFQWFAEGMEEMDPDARARFFRRCGRACCETAPLGFYRAHFEAVGRDLDAFFARLSEIPGARGLVAEPGQTYEIAFDECLCDLHTQGYLDTDVLCECSKASVERVMEALAPERPCRVEKIHTILGGADECRFRIEFPEEETRRLHAAGAVI